MVSDIEMFGNLLHIQNQAKTIQHYQNEQTQLNCQLAIMRSLASGGLPFDTVNSSSQSNMYCPATQNIPSSSINSAGVQHQTLQLSPNLSNVSQWSNAVMRHQETPELFPQLLSQQKLPMQVQIIAA